MLHPIHWQSVVIDRTYRSSSNINTWWCCRCSVVFCTVVQLYRSQFNLFSFGPPSRSCAPGLHPGVAVIVKTESLVTSISFFLLKTEQFDSLFPPSSKRSAISRPRKHIHNKPKAAAQHTWLRGRKRNGSLLHQEYRERDKNGSIFFKCRTV
jgi:hypothetical protein